MKKLMMKTTTMGLTKIGVKELFETECRDMIIITNEEKCTGYEIMVYLLAKMGCRMLVIYEAKTSTDEILEDIRSFTADCILYINIDELNEEIKGLALTRLNHYPGRGQRGMELKLDEELDKLTLD